ncbi:MAG: hypothetical protein KatS3mg060_0530 [Dehalococcoidia bacterium]|nr:MAG: hypothetical protein KatS3mg060_0530 [Dehalococcoidia bacterium]
MCHTASDTAVADVLAGIPLGEDARLHYAPGGETAHEGAVMIVWRALFGLLAAGLVVAPAAAQSPGMTVRTLAEGSQGTLPVGPLVWQGFEHIFHPGDRSQVVGEDAGFTWVVDGVAQLQLEGQPRAAVPAGSAVATASGVRRGLGGVDPTGAVVWVIGLGGPTPGAFQMPPRLVFRSEPIVPPGGGSFVYRLSRIDLAGSGDLPPAETAGTITLYVIEGALSLRVPDGGSVLRAGSVTTIPAEGGARLTPLGGRPASVLAIALLAGAPTVPATVTVPPSALPETSPDPAPIPFPLLPTGAFPRLGR